jgi:hypothetical protein
MVTMILPLTNALVHGRRWSWCESKVQRLRFKKSIADAAVAGVVPEGHLRTPPLGLLVPCAATVPPELRRGGRLQFVPKLPGGGRLQA